MREPAKQKMITYPGPTQAGWSGDYGAVLTCIDLAEERR